MIANKVLQTTSTDNHPTMWLRIRHNLDMYLSKHAAPTAKTFERQVWMAMVRNADTLDLKRIEAIANLRTWTMVKKLGCRKSLDNLPNSAAGTGSN
jgi:hypothetical protein